MKILKNLVVNFPFGLEKIFESILFTPKERNPPINTVISGAVKPSNWD